MDKRTVEDILRECFGTYKPKPRINTEVLEIVEKKRAERRSELEKLVAEKKLKELHGKNIKIHYNDAHARADKTRLRLQRKLMEKDMRKIAD
tara:strand:+ start:191 stop:466 length:276 start_codon:yes stop_codon:yes gene_type:complete